MEKEKNRYWEHFIDTISFDPFNKENVDFRCELGSWHSQLTPFATPLSCLPSLLPTSGTKWTLAHGRDPRLRPPSLPQSAKPSALNPMDPPWRLV